MKPRAISGAGLGFRRELIPDLKRGVPDHIRFFEIAPENWLGIGGASAKDLRAFTERFSFACHGLSLSLGGPAPRLPEGRTASEKRGRRFFEDVPPDPSQGLKPGLCAHCHSGPLMNQTNQFAQFFIPSPAPIPAGQRFLSVGVSEFNTAQNPVREFVFNPGTPQEAHLVSPDPGRALITGIIDDPTLEHVNAFKISPLRGIRRTAPYFHDNSAMTLEDVAAHYANFFRVVSGGFIDLSKQDEKDIAAFMRLLD